MRTTARLAGSSLLVLAGCLASPPGGVGDGGLDIDAGLPPVACEVPEDCPENSDDTSCHCGQCATSDLDCPPSNLRYVAEGGSSAGCVPGPEQLALGLQLSCLRWSDGKVSCWGTNCNGQLGSGGEPSCPGDLSTKPSLVRVEAGGAPLENVVSLKVGLRHACALRSGGSVWCWGDNLAGKLGDGTAETIRSSPVQVIVEDNSSPLGNIAVLAAGGHHTCAVDQVEIVWCWGDNDYYQLGIAGPGDHGAAVQLAGPPGWKSLSGGGLHTCGTRSVEESGPETLWCWGRKTFGQIGNGTTGEPGEAAPVLVGYEDDLGTTLVPNAVGLGIDFSCAAVIGPSALCWGRNIGHALGDDPLPGGSDGENAAAARAVVLAAPSGIEQITAGGDFVCARLGDHSLQCWGSNTLGQLGLGATSAPQPPTALDVDVVDVAAGTDHACAITSDQRVICWGNNDQGQLGDDTQIARPAPTDVIGLCQ